jgi:hypothetical protein
LTTSEATTAVAASTASLARVLENLDWTSLSPRAQAIARRFGPMLLSGCSRAEIARYYGKSDAWVSSRLEELKAELLEQARG